MDRQSLTGEEKLRLRDIYTTCEQYAVEPQGWLVLMGKSGTGKTHLAAAIVNDLIARGVGDVMFIGLPDLLDHLRAAFSPTAGASYDRRFNDIKKIPCLVLDDLGTESATPWAKEKLYQLLNYRYIARLPTIVTTSQFIDDIEPWLKTRMLDVNLCKWCNLNIPSYIRYRSGTGESSTRSKRGSRNRR